jgi:hypothetical protein
MSLKRSLVRAYSGAMSRGGDFLARRLKHNFYLYLAGLFTVVVVLDVLVFHQLVDLRQKSYDVVIKHRLIKPKPSADIVIVDIDEASLAALSKEYGRWPWPRQVLGEFVQQLEEQKPKAIVFDILFSDPDIYNATAMRISTMPSARPAIRSSDAAVTAGERQALASEAFDDPRRQTARGASAISRLQWCCRSSKLRSTAGA